MKPVIIGIDASRAIQSIRTDTDNYSRELIKSLLDIDKINSYVLYAPHLPADGFADAPNVAWRILPQKRLWSQVKLAKEIQARPPEVLFVPSHVVPLLSNVPSVVTIHDLAYKYFPRAYSIFDRRYLNFTTGVSVSKASRVIVPSSATKSDLLKEYKVLKGSKIAVIPYGYNQGAFNVTVPYPSPLASPYIFYVGRLEEKKNLELLIDAFRLLSKEKRPPHLVLAGKAGYGWEQIQRKIASLPSRDRSRVILSGFMPTYDVARYLRHAAAFVFPSLHEGSGKPIIEAMATGVPVICSNIPALSEAGGKAAVLLKPENPLTWAGAISRVLNQPDYAQKLTAAGLEQAKQYSWTKAAQQTLQILIDVAHKKS